MSNAAPSFPPPPPAYFLRHMTERVLSLLTDDWQTCTQIGVRCSMHPARVGVIMCRLLATRQAEVHYKYGPELGLTKIKPYYRLRNQQKGTND
jgi:hypothetical protein